LKNRVRTVIFMHYVLNKFANVAQVMLVVESTVKEVYQLQKLSHSIISNYNSLYNF